MRRPRRHRGYQMNSDINIANLVDVVLVLLIIFMISAPLLQSGIEVDLPETRTAPIQEEPNAIVLTIDAQGGVYINDIFTNPTRFEADLEDAMAREGTRDVFIRGDSAVSYGTAIDVVARLRELGINNIGLVTATKEESDR